MPPREVTNDWISEGLPFSPEMAPRDRYLIVNITVRIRTPKAGACVWLLRRSGLRAVMGALIAFQSWHVEAQLDRDGPDPSYVAFMPADQR